MQKQGVLGVSLIMKTTSTNSWSKPLSQRTGWSHRRHLFHTNRRDLQGLWETVKLRIL